MPVMALISMATRQELRVAGSHIQMMPCKLCILHICLRLPADHLFCSGRKEAAADPQPLGVPPPEIAPANVPVEGWAAVGGLGDVDQAAQGDGVAATDLSRALPRHGSPRRPR